LIFLLSFFSTHSMMFAKVAVVVTGSLILTARMVKATTHAEDSQQVLFPLIVARFVCRGYVFFVFL
jgi:hypothetical protein